MEELLAARIARLFSSLMIGAACVLLPAVPGSAADCQRDSFDSWLEGFKQDASAQGLSKGRSHLH